MKEEINELAYLFPSEWKYMFNYIYEVSELNNEWENNELAQLFSNEIIYERMSIYVALAHICEMRAVLNSWDNIFVF